MTQTTATAPDFRAEIDSLVTVGDVRDALLDRGLTWEMLDFVDASEQSALVNCMIEHDIRLGSSENEIRVRPREDKRETTRLIARGMARGQISEMNDSQRSALLDCMNENKIRFRLVS